MQYIERNPLRAGLLDRAEAWSCSSLPWPGAPERAPVRLEEGAVPRGALWVEGVNAATADVESAALRESIRRDRPYRAPGWTRETARALGLESSLRPRGRPRAVEEGTIT